MKSLGGGAYTCRNVGSQRGCSTAQGRPECGRQGRKELNRGLEVTWGLGAAVKGLGDLNHPIQSLHLAFPVEDRTASASEPSRQQVLGARDALSHPEASLPLSQSVFP